MAFFSSITCMLLDGGVSYKDGQQFLSGKWLAGERFPGCIGWSRTASPRPRWRAASPP